MSSGASGRWVTNLRLGEDFLPVLLLLLRPLLDQLLLRMMYASGRATVSIAAQKTRPYRAFSMFGAGVKHAQQVSMREIWLRLDGFGSLPCMQSSCRAQSSCKSFHPHRSLPRKPPIPVRDHGQLRLA